MSPDSPCRTKSGAIDPSSAQAVTDPIDSRAVDTQPDGEAAWPMHRRHSSDAAAEGGDDLIERLDRELAQRRIDLAEAGLKRASIVGITVSRAS